MRKLAASLRQAAPQTVEKLIAQGANPLLAKIWAGRGLSDFEMAQPKLAQLLDPKGLLGGERAAQLLAQAIQQHEKICIVADYDCDGATACAVAIKGLRRLGVKPENLDFIVPNRFETGYGLSPAVVDLVLAHPRLGKPRWIVTVDNGIASFEGVAYAAQHGIDCIITDHHLPAQGQPPPAAKAIVNPNQHGCTFASKALAGVGVMFYTLLLLRAELRTQGVFTKETEPRLDDLLDLVALGTVADLVPLDRNNRALVAAGLARMRGGKACAGIAAIFSAASKKIETANTQDMGFALGPRINAAGRLADMSLGIQCLLAESFAQAEPLAAQLSSINAARRELQSEMSEEALASWLEKASETPAQSCVIAYEPHWHEGIVGLIASKLKDAAYLPAFAFAPSPSGVLKGSGRSIAGLHLRDALDLVAKQNPKLIDKFGGHAMAAGLSLAPENLSEFTDRLRAVCEQLLSPEIRQKKLLTDGSLRNDLAHLNPDFVDEMNRYVWGQGFEAPLFVDTFAVQTQRIVGEKHLKLQLALNGKSFDAIWFFNTEALPEAANLAYTVSVNEYLGRRSVQLMIEAKLV